MLSQSTSSNLSEALINVKKIEKNFINREFSFLDRDRNKIRANVDRHMETFLQLTRKRHETWYRHDKHFREALRKEKDRHEKRKERNRQKMLFITNPDYVPRVHTPFQPITTDDIILPPPPTTTTTTEQVIFPPVTTENISLPPTITETVTLPSANTGNVILPKSSTENITLPPITTTKTHAPLITTTPRLEPMTKVERRTHQVLRASQKLLDESAARTRYKLEFDRPSSSTFSYKKPSPPAPTSSSCSFNSATLIVPMTTSIDCEEYDRLMNESLQRETFGEFVDHFVKFRPEYREQFGLIHEASKRQKAIEKLRQFNQIQAKTKDERYHNLISSLTDLRSEQKGKYY